MAPEMDARMKPADMPNKGKHVPLRMCVICRRRAPKCALTRFTAAAFRSGMAAIEPDRKQQAPGRGVYLCDAPECREAFSRRRVKRKAKGQEL